VKRRGPKGLVFGGAGGPPPQFTGFRGGDQATPPPPTEGPRSAPPGEKTHVGLPGPQGSTPPPAHGFVGSEVGRTRKPGGGPPVGRFGSGTGGARGHLRGMLKQRDSARRRVLLGGRKKSGPPQNVGFFFFFFLGIENRVFGARPAGPGELPRAPKAGAIPGGFGGPGGETGRHPGRSAKTFLDKKAGGDGRGGPRGALGGGARAVKKKPCWARFGHLGGGRGPPGDSRPTGRFLAGRGWFGQRPQPRISGGFCPPTAFPGPAGFRPGFSTFFL